MARWHSSRRWVALAAALLVLASCSSDDDDSDDASPTTTDDAFTGRAPEEIVTPSVEGAGIALPQPAPPLPDGYVQEELFVGGTATSFDAVDTPDDGTWTATPSDEADYRTRVIVRRPPADAFSGTVLVEWFNVSAIESAPDWTFLFEEIGRAGHAYVGVSTQAQGVEGGQTLLDVEVDEDAAPEAEGVTDNSGLKNIDPERYGTLEHPGDAYAFDIFSQVGRAAVEAPGELLGGLEPEHVIGMGESQSAIFLSTLVNAVHPLDPVFDGFLVHSRGAGVAPLDGDFTSARAEADDDQAIAQRAVTVRTDLDVPVFLFETETDLTLLQYVQARQPDTELVRTWEVAGTAHADAHLLRSVVGGPRDPSVGSFIGCTEPINTGPQHEVLQAALSHLVAWVVEGTPPPEGQRIEATEGDETTIVRDERGNALGGVRSPLVDVPVATLSGDPPGGGTLDELVDDEEGDGGSRLCALFGQTITFDRAQLVELYGTADDYLAAFGASAEEAVEAGFLLRDDADQLIEEAEANRARFE